MKGTKGTNGSCREVLEAKMEKKLPARHNLVGLPSPDLTLPHPYTRIPVFSPFKSILSGDFGRKKCWDPKYGDRSASGERQRANASTALPLSGKVSHLARGTAQFRDLCVELV